MGVWADRSKRVSVLSIVSAVQCGAPAGWCDKQEGGSNQTAGGTHTSQLLYINHQADSETKVALLSRQHKTTQDDSKHITLDKVSTDLSLQAL
jgi:hypothetical protein